MSALSQPVTISTSRPRSRLLATTRPMSNRAVLRASMMTSHSTKRRKIASFALKEEQEEAPQMAVRRLMRRTVLKRMRRGFKTNRSRSRTAAA